MQEAIPYLLALAAASFIYIAVADLVPALQIHCKPLDFAVQFTLIGGGVGLVAWGDFSLGFLETKKIYNPQIAYGDTDHE